MGGVAERKEESIRLAVALLTVAQTTTQQAPDLEIATDYLRCEKATSLCSIICCGE